MKILERNQARQLRREGLSLKAICLKVGCSKSSVSVWVRDIPLRLSPSQSRERQTKRRQAQLKGSKANQAKWASIRKEAFDAGYLEASTDAEFRVICALYWGEGTKESGFALANCNPQMHNLITKWLVEHGFGHQFYFAVTYYNPALTEVAIRHYWLKALIWADPSHLRHIYLRPTNTKRGKIHAQPHGTATLYVGNVRLFERIRGGMAYLRGSASFKTYSHSRSRSSDESDM